MSQWYPSPHRRQFVIAGKDYQPPQGWLQHALSGDRVLYRCPKLEHLEAADRDGAKWHLLGFAVPIERGGPGLRAQIEAALTDEVHRLSVYWSGRFVLIGNDGVHLDATGRLGVFVRRGKAGRLLVSSSPALLGGYPGLPPCPPASPALRYEYGIRFRPAPGSAYRGVHRVTSSQTVNLHTGQLRDRELLADPGLRKVEDALAFLVDGLTGVLHNLAADGRPIWLGLTGGVDSRVLLALAVKAGIPCRTYTRRSPRMSMADRTLPPKLARIAGLDHSFVPVSGSADPEERGYVLQEHAGGTVSAGDVRPFLSGERDEVDGVNINGAMFELLKKLGRYRSLPASPENPAEVAGAVLAVNQENRSGFREDLETWYERVSHGPAEGIDWRDRFLIEQELGAYNAGKELVSDLLPAVRMPVMNCAAFIGCILRLPDEVRVSAKLSRRMIEICEPDLLSLPFNPSDWSYLLQRPAQVLGRQLSRQLRFHGLG